MSEPFDLEKWRAYMDEHFARLPLTERSLSDSTPLVVAVMGKSTWWRRAWWRLRCLLSNARYPRWWLSRFS